MLELLLNAAPELVMLVIEHDFGSPGAGSLLNVVFKQGIDIDIGKVWTMLVTGLIPK
jgi:hypothetical protein